MKNWILKGLMYLFMTVLLSQCFQCAPLNSVRSKTVGPVHITKLLMISEDFNQAEINLIEIGANEWMSTTGGIVQFEMHSFNKDYMPLIQNREDFIIFMESHEGGRQLASIDDEIRKKEKGSFALGYYDQENVMPTIFIVGNRINSFYIYRQVVVHEFGHALGLGHDENTTNSIMYHSMDKAAKHITLNDLVPFCKIYYCSPNSLKRNLQLPTP